MNSSANELLTLAPWILSFTIFLAGRWIVRLVARRSVYIYGHRIPKNGEDASNGTTTFRFAIQNADSTAVEVPMIATLSIPGDHGQIDSEPKIYAGPRKLLGRFDESARSYQIEFDRFPAYDTWVIECRVREPVEGVQFVLNERRGERDRAVRNIRDTQILVTPGTPLAQAGHMRAPALPLVTASWLAGLASYVFVLTSFMTYYQYTYTWKQVLVIDLPICLGLLLLAAIGIGVIRRHGPSPIQGYWDPTRIKFRPVLEGPREISGERTSLEPAES